MKNGLIQVIRSFFQKVQKKSKSKKKFKLNIFKWLLRKIYIENKSRRNNNIWPLHFYEDMPSENDFHAIWKRYLEKHLLNFYLVVFYLLLTSVHFNTFIWKFYNDLTQNFLLFFQEFLDIFRSFLEVSSVSPELVGVSRGFSRVFRNFFGVSSRGVS